MCLKCLYDCYTCRDNLGCLTCNSTVDFRTINASTSRCMPLTGYYDNNTQQSQKCPSICIMCSSATNCSKCSTSYYLQSDNFCYAGCTLGFFADNVSQTCKICPNLCKSCNSATVCT